VAIKVVSSSRYGDLSGLAAVRRGMRLEVHARRAQGAWVATRIERVGSGSWDWDGHHGSSEGHGWEDGHGCGDDGMHG
jgi:hypothetical protein